MMCYFFWDTVYIGTSAVKSILCQTGLSRHLQFLTSGHSNAHGWALECPDVKNYKWRLNPVWQRMLYSCTHMAAVGIKVLNSAVKTVHTALRHHCPTTRMSWSISWTAWNSTWVVIERCLVMVCVCCQEAQSCRLIWSCSTMLKLPVCWVRRQVLRVTRHRPRIVMLRRRTLHVISASLHW